MEVPRCPDGAHVGGCVVRAGWYGKPPHRGGNRQLNCALHRLAVNKGKWDPDTAAYLERKQAEGKSRKEALRCLKRHLARRVWKLLHSPPAPAAPRTPTPATIAGTAPALMPCLT
jgi:hypothetical protein